MTTESKQSVSFVFPVYNEEHIIEKVLRSYYNEFNGKLNFEMIVAEDGSTDRTKEIIKRLSTELPLTLHMHDGRKGYLQAIKDALKHAKNEWIFLVDSDNQFDPHDFWKLWPHRNENDIILGRKMDRKDGFLRYFLSRGYNLILKILFFLPYMDMDTGFRLFRRTLVGELVDSIHNLGYFTAEFVIKAHLKGYKILEVPVNHFAREMNSSNIFSLERIPYLVARELVGIYKLFLEMKIRRI